MKAPHFFALAIVVASAFCATAQSAKKQSGDRERLIGAWHLAHIEAPGTDAKASEALQPKGMLIYTRDGHMSVQLMYPKAAKVANNVYVRDGYEASFGSYDVDEAKHLLTHHVRGSNTGDMLVGKDLPRVYQFTSDGKLEIRPARAGEHWSVTWEHY